MNIYTDPAISPGEVADLPRPLRTLFLDTETTGKYPGPDGDEALSISIIDDAGTVLLDTLIQPVRHTSWPGAQRIHGITPVDVFSADVPTLEYLTPLIADLLRDCEVIIYSADFDTQVLAEAFALGPPAYVECAMLAFADFVGDYNHYHGSNRWHSLSSAAAMVGHEWTGAAHGALADARACRDVWAYVTDADARGRMDTARVEAELQQQVEWHLAGMWGREHKAAEKELNRRNWAWEAVHFPAMGVQEFRDPNERTAEESADVFCRQLTCYPVAVWNRYGKLLNLKRYGQPDQPKRPKHLVSGEDVYILRPSTLVPAAMCQKDKSFPHSAYANRLAPLYSLRKLVLGVDYVPRTLDYVEGYCSRTALVRDHKLKPKAADQVRPAFLKVSRNPKYDDYLLYPIPTPQPETPALVGTETNGAI